MVRIAPDNLDVLVAAIWGIDAVDAPVADDPGLRAAQNAALGLAIRAYLQSYLDDMPHTSRDDDPVAEKSRA